MTVPAASLQEMNFALLPVMNHLLNKNLRYLRYSFLCPESSSDVTTAISRLGTPVSKSLAILLTKFASRFEFSWALHRSVKLGEDVSVFGGHLLWDAHAILDLYQEKCQAERGTVFEEQWRDKIPFMAFGNGDFLAVSMQSDDCSAYYLSPGDPPYASRRLGDLFPFLSTWCRLGCVYDPIVFLSCALNGGQEKGSNTHATTWLAWLSSPPPSS